MKPTCSISTVEMEARARHYLSMDRDPPLDLAAFQFAEMVVELSQRLETVNPFIARGEEMVHRCGSTCFTPEVKT